MSSDRHTNDPHTRQPGPHGAAAGDETVRRPGPHGAAAQDAIQRAYRRAERRTEKTFQEVTPKRVVAAEAVTSLDDESDQSPPSRRRLIQSRACFIATAAYGDPDAPEVAALRRFRDNHLLTNPMGMAFVRCYYRMSPPVARLIARRPRLRVAVRRTLGLLRRVDF